MQDVSAKALVAEGMGSAWLVLSGSGTAVLAAGFPVLGVGFLGIAVAWGVGLFAAGYGLGRHALAGFMPTMAVGMWCAGTLSFRQCVFGIVAQVLGSILGAGVLWLIVSPIPSFDVHQGFAGNGYAALSPGDFSLAGVALVECVMAFFLVVVVMSGRPAHRHVLAAGGVVVMALLTVTVDNAMVSSARSVAVALFAGGDWLRQQWVFQLSPLLGAALGGGAVRWLWCHSSRDAALHAGDALLTPEQRKMDEAPGHSSQRRRAGLD